MAAWRFSSNERNRDRHAEMLEELEERHKRFRILVCINGTDASYEGLNFAAEIGRDNPCDIILLYVRRIDQGLNSGGLQVRIARQNMLDWGLELPGIEYLRRGYEMLVDLGYMTKDWRSQYSHTDIFGDPLGDNKVEYRSGRRKRIILKLKTAPTVASGILDQYELGPYNLIIMGPPRHWRGGIKSFIDPSTVQKVAMLSPCSVLTVRGSIDKKKGFLICIDGTEHCTKSMKQAAVLACNLKRPITLLSVAKEKKDLPLIKTRLSAAENLLADMGVKNVKTISRTGNCLEELLAIAKRFGIVVVADSGKSRVKRFLKGNIAFNVMGSAPVSVMNVR
ncbi:MAG TPA: universal stress protein [Rhizobiales bacterium]|nr:universal stress protein family protein [bacterium BMS3Bbin10]HDO52447.1 universal stress protein [Hyphomicrobiales bacterium]